LRVLHPHRASSRRARVRERSLGALARTGSSRRSRTRPAGAARHRDVRRARRRLRSDLKRDIRMAKIAAMRRRPRWRSRSRRCRELTEATTPPGLRQVRDQRQVSCTILAETQRATSVHWPGSDAEAAVMLAVRSYRAREAPARYRRLGGDGVCAGRSSCLRRPPSPTKPSRPPSFPTWWRFWSPGSAASGRVQLWRRRRDARHRWWGPVTSGRRRPCSGALTRRDTDGAG